MKLSLSSRARCHGNGSQAFNVHSRPASAALVDRAQWRWTGAVRSHLFNAYAALCRDTFSRASNSEHCVRSVSSGEAFFGFLAQQERINQRNRTLSRCRYRCDQVTQRITPSASDFVVLPFIDRARYNIAEPPGVVPKQ
jgi:hypothetical protein